MIYWLVFNISHLLYVDHDKFNTTVEASQPLFKLMHIKFQTLQVNTSALGMGNKKLYVYNPSLYAIDIMSGTGKTCN